MRVLSPRMLPPERALDGSTASTATRFPSADEVEPERLDERALARARHAGDADPRRPTRVRKDPVEEALRLLLVIRACARRA